jgi:hypothetical protein
MSIDARLTATTAAGLDIQDETGLAAARIDGLATSGRGALETNRVLGAVSILPARN